METIQDVLREEARDHQELAAMSYKRHFRERLDYRATDEWARNDQEYTAHLYYQSRSALFELIGAEPETAERSS